MARERKEEKIRGKEKEEKEEKGGKRKKKWWKDLFAKTENGERVAAKMQGVGTEKHQGKP